MKRVVVCAAAVALGIAGISSAHAESGLKVTGGGQAFASAADAQGGGPGDTYGFNAQAIEGAEDDAAKGNLNVIDRDPSATKARGQGEHIKGSVTCLQALSNDGAEDSQGVARFGGVLEDGTFFAVDVTDNGEGKDSDDLILFRIVEPEDDESPCDVDNENDEMHLARGNVQIHNYEEPEE